MLNDVCTQNKINSSSFIRIFGQSVHVKSIICLNNVPFSLQISEPADCAHGD